MKTVRLTRRFTEMKNVTQEPLNPHPVFPLWSQWDVYPYQYYGKMRKYARRQKYYMPSIENEFLRVSIAPDIGGRIWDIYDKIGKRHVINFNNEVHNYNAGFGLNYTSGGLECNYPHAHACTTSRPREVGTRKNPDGSASIICSEYERIWRTRWSVTYTLYPDRSFVELTVRIYNRTPHDSRYMYWNNCGFYLTPNTQFIYPEDEASMHGAELKTFSWPMWQHRDLSIFGRTPPEMLGLYMLDAREPYFGYYNHDEGHGLVHYGDLADLPGKKSWTWGTDPGYCEQLRKSHHGLGKIYGEVQSGRIVIQEHLDRLPPETECEWNEIWYPVRGIGAFNSAGPGAALRAEIIEASSRRTVLKVTAMANGDFPDARLVIISDELAPVEQPFVVNPISPSERIVKLNGKAGPDLHTQVLLKSKDGEVLTRCRLRRPNKRDSWREVVDYEKPVEAVGAEQLFFEAERLARDWGNHDLKPLYEKPLALDPGHTPSHRELGKLAAWQGLYNDAAKHFETALARDTDSVELRYFHGVALMLADRTADARKAFEMSNRYDCEARALVRLAELRMREDDFHHALRHLDRLSEAHPRLTRPRGLRCACLRRLGRAKEAAVEIAAALDIDGNDPFLRIEAMFVKAGGLDIRRLPRKAQKDLLDQVRHDEPPLLEAAFDYFAAGLFEEAASVTRIIPNPGPLGLFTHAYALARAGRGADALKALKRACESEVTNHQIWRLEMFEIMAWAQEQLPKHPRPLFLLGNLLMARRRTEEGLELWLKAAHMGEKHWLLFSNLGFYHARVAKEMKKALAWFQKAEKACPSDLYVKDEIAACLSRPGAVIGYLEKRKKHVLSSPKLVHALLNAYLKLNRYEKFDALCKQLDFPHNWQIPGPHTLWIPRHLQEAVSLLQSGKPEKSLKILKDLGRAPEHLGIATAYSTEEDRRYYHMGRCYEKMGRMDEARSCWEKTLQVPHFTGYEHAYWYREWSRRYFQALALDKLGRHSEANAFFDAMEIMVHTNEIPLNAKDSLLGLVERGRFASEDRKDPITAVELVVETRAEE